MKNQNQIFCILTGNISQILSILKKFKTLYGNTRLGGVIENIKNSYI